MWKLKNETYQVILLTWAQFDKYITEALQASAIWAGVIDCNVVYAAKKYIAQDNQYLSEMLSDFAEWKDIERNLSDYKEMENEFLEGRCYHPNINLFSNFLRSKYIVTSGFRCAQVITHGGLPFVETDRQ